MKDWRTAVKSLGFAVALAAALTSPAVATDTVTYTYDALGRVISVSHSTGTTIYYSYDPAGNRTVKGPCQNVGVWGSFNWGSACW